VLWLEPRTARRLSIAVLGAGLILGVGTTAAGAQEPDTFPDIEQETTTTTAPPPTTTTTAPPPTTTTTAPPPTTTTTRPPATTTTAAPATTTTAAPTTTSTSSSTTTSTSSTTTTTLATKKVSDDDGKGSGFWILIGLLALALAAAAAWFISRFVTRKQSLADWDKQQRRVLGDAQRAHDASVDLLARWSSMTADQLADRWGQEMSRLERLRERLSTLLTTAPEGAALVPLQNVASAVDNLHIALGGVDPTQAWAPQPVDAVAACDNLQVAIEDAQGPPDQHQPR
jgi:hypothetical protein